MEKVVLEAKPHLRNFSQSELETFLEQQKFPRFRANQILNWIYQKDVRMVSQMKNLSRELIEFLESKTVLNRLELISKHGAQNGESIKYLTKTDDGHFCESVLISQSGRNTVCVSTQLGCRIRCIFCASGKGKFGRNLSAGEIVEQVSIVQNDIKEPVTNIVFMGMGEPLDNYEATMKSLEILQADWGFDLGGRRITVSTSGITPKIEQFVKETEGRVRLSISLHSAIDETRSYLVPINKKYGLAEMTQALDYLHRKLKREITFEYTLIDQVNDSREEAEATAKLASRLGAKVNIIPYNPIQEMEFKTPSREKIELFKNVLTKKNVRVTVRQTAGRDINAACGQLRLDRI